MGRYLLLLGMLLLVGCSDRVNEVPASQAPSSTEVAADSSAAPSTSTPADPAPTTTVVMPFVVPETLADFELADISLDGVALKVAVADDRAERQQGLMGVEDLLCLDGMLFVFEEDVTTGFWMKNTLIPLDIAFFTADGRYVDGFTMEPCAGDPCPVYQPGGAYRYALEMAAGDMPEVVRELDFTR